MDFTAEDYQEEYDAWREDYEIGEFIEYSEENWEKVQKMDPRYVWTNHGTCEDEMVTNGAKLFSGRCCWDTYGWYVANAPWGSGSKTDEDYFESVKATAYLSCETCNPDGEGEEEDFDPECEKCEGEGYVHHYFD